MLLCVGCCKFVVVGRILGLSGLLVRVVVGGCCLAVAILLCGLRHFQLGFSIRLRV